MTIPWTWASSHYRSYPRNEEKRILVPWLYSATSILVNTANCEPFVSSEGNSGRVVVSVHRKCLGAQIGGIKAKSDCRGISDNDHLKEAAGACGGRLWVLNETKIQQNWMQDSRKVGTNAVRGPGFHVNRDQEYDFEYSHHLRKTNFPSD